MPERILVLKIGRLHLLLRCVCSRKRASKYFPKIHNEELYSNIISKCAVFIFIRKENTKRLCLVLSWAMTEKSI